MSVKGRVDRTLHQLRTTLGFGATDEAASQRKRKIHFLHIGKAAGSQLKTLFAHLNQEQQALRFVGHDHDCQLRDLPPQDEYFFAIRDPISRFMSGFYSRKRMGRPRYDYPWTRDEKIAFSDFDHARDLAEALFEPGVLGMKAVGAMKAIRHTGQDQIDWFVLRGEIFSVRPPLWIVRQENFEEDLCELLNRCDIASHLPSDAGTNREHANDYSGVPEISAIGREKLERWYSQDFAFYSACETWIAVQSDRRDGQQAGERRFS